MVRGQRRIPRAFYLCSFSSPTLRPGTQRTWNLNINNLTTTLRALTLEDFCGMITIFRYRSFSFTMLARWESRQVGLCKYPPEMLDLGICTTSCSLIRLASSSLMQDWVYLPIIYPRVPESMHRDPLSKTSLFRCHLLSLTCASASVEPIYL